MRLETKVVCFLKKRVLVIKWERMIVAKKRTAKRIKAQKSPSRMPNGLKPPACTGRIRK